jgi:hypothetical protein
MKTRVDRDREWRSKLAAWTAGFLIFETLTGLSIWLLPFSLANQVMVLVHTGVGLVFLIPCAWYLVRHWLLYRRKLMTHIKLLGYAGLAVLALCAVSGLVLTYQAIWATRISSLWSTIHILTTFGVLAFVLPHIILLVVGYRRAESGASLRRAAGAYGWGGAMATLVFGGLVGLILFAYEPPKLQTDFDADYSFLYGEDRPFAPSLATTTTGGAIDSRLLAGSRGCGTVGCHEQIYVEWEASAHRYAAMDPAFQKIQLTMAEQNSPESTRYCGGCHDPISLFSGTKNIFTDAEQLTSLTGYHEGVSCMGCHAIRETDIKGNAHFAMAAPKRYMFELEYNETESEIARFFRDFLIRAYPRHHIDSLNKHLFKTPEYCAACHKQFIDEEINNVGWVQLQNQFDNWRMSRWNHPGDPERTVECRECHMPLVESRDPAAGDAADYNRSPRDGKHRSHRFLGANQMIPKMLQLPGWEKQTKLTEDWLRGEFPIPEIAHKWAEGPAVSLELILPERVVAGREALVRAVITSNKVGHDFPTGPLDMIQSWVELVITDEAGREVFSTGTVDDDGFIQPGSFIFKAEPVDQYGNLIDRHNLWEMVGVRHRRALFPGFADIAQFRFQCPDLTRWPEGSSNGVREEDHAIPVPEDAGSTLRVEARLKYRKIDQSLMNFIFGADSGLTAPITVMDTHSGTIRVVRDDS